MVDFVTSTRAALQRLATKVNSKIAKGELVYSVVDYGADATGVGSSKAAVISAMAAAAPGSTIYFPPGFYDWTGDVVITKARLTFRGPGVIRGRFTVGDGTAKFESKARFLELRFVHELVKATWLDKGYDDGSYFIGVDRATRITIQNCEFYGAAWPVYVKPNASCAPHDNGLIRVIDNEFSECDWAFYGLWDPQAVGYSGVGTGWQCVSDCFFIGNIVNRSYLGMVYFQGIDGITISDNISFLLNYASTTNGRWLQKQQNIRIDWSDFVNIHDNQLFEAGLEGILLTNVRTYKITGNEIIWPGQRVMSDGISVTAAASGEYGMGVIADNTIQYYTKSAVSVKGNHGELQLGTNSIRYSATTDKYMGNPAPTDVTKTDSSKPAMTSINHYRYDISGVTGVLPAEIKIVDGLIPKTGFYDLFPTFNYIQHFERVNAWGAQGAGFRSSTFTAGNNSAILSLKDVLGATTTYQGKVLIEAKFGSSSTAKSSWYELTISKTPLSSDVYVLQSGYTSGAAADEPSFTWSISGSNSLLATPVGLTAGTFSFSFIFMGNIMVG